MAQKTNSVIFIHGLWLHASSWAPWEDFFGKAGYDTIAPGWPGDQDTVELAAPTRTLSPTRESTT